MALVAGVFLWLPAAHAASGGEHAAGIGWDFFFKVLNFAVLVFILWKITRKNLPPFLAKRHDELSEQIDAAKATEAQAQSLLREYDRKLGELGTLMQEMLAEARQQAEEEKERLIQQAKRDAEEIVRSAERSARSLEARAQHELRSLIARQALLRAEAKAVEALAGEAAQSQLVDRFVHEVNTLEGR